MPSTKPEGALLMALERGEIHVWFADTSRLPADQLQEQYLSLLDAEERDRFHRFHFDRDRLTYLAAHALVRITLSRYAECLPGQWRFVHGSYGKPEIEVLPGLPPLRFNLTHTKGMVACVVAFETDCGIDVESIRRMTDMRGIAKTVFSDTEIAYLEAQPEPAWPQTFFSIWTLKEAYIKAVGLGFSAPLRQITFDIGTSRVFAQFAGEVADDPELWIFHRHTPNDSHLLAVAARTVISTDAIIYRELDLLRD